MKLLVLLSAFATLPMCGDGRLVAGSTTFCTCNALNDTLLTFSAGPKGIALVKREALLSREARVLDIIRMPRRNGLAVLYRAGPARKVAFLREPGLKPVWSESVSKDAQRICCDVGNERVFVVGYSRVERIDWFDSAPRHSRQVGVTSVPNEPHMGAAVGSNGTLYVSFVGSVSDSTGGGLFEFPAGGKVGARVLHKMADGVWAVVASEDHRLIAALGYGESVSVIRGSGRKWSKSCMALPRYSMPVSGSISPDNTRMIVADSTGHFLFFNIRAGTLGRPIQTPKLVGAYPQMTVDWSRDILCAMDDDSSDHYHAYNHLSAYHVLGTSLRRLSTPMNLMKEGHLLVLDSQSGF
jgi:hypothetical protein